MTVVVTSPRCVRGVRVADVRRDAARLLQLLGVDAELRRRLVDDGKSAA
jgi:hypothetical protein